MTSMVTSSLHPFGGENSIRQELQKSAGSTVSTAGQLPTGIVEERWPAMTDDKIKVLWMTAGKLSYV